MNLSGASQDSNIVVRHECNTLCFDGEFVQGNFCLLLKKSITIDCVSIQLLQAIQAGATGAEKQDGQPIGWRVDNSGVFVLEEKIYAGVGTLEPGEHKLGFRFLIPEHSPSTSPFFQGNEVWGGVQYSVQSIFQQRRGLQVVTRTDVEVVGHSDLWFNKPLPFLRLEGRKKSFQINVTSQSNLVFSNQKPSVVLEMRSSTKKRLEMEMSLVFTMEMNAGNGRAVKISQVASKIKESFSPYFHGVRTVTFTKPASMVGRSFFANGVHARWLVMVQVAKLNLVNSMEIFMGSPQPFSRSGRPGGVAKQGTAWIMQRNVWQSDQPSCQRCGKEHFSHVQVWKEKSQMRHHCRFCMLSVCGACTGVPLENTPYLYPKPERACGVCQQSLPEIKTPSPQEVISEFVEIVHIPEPVYPHMPQDFKVPGFASNQNTQTIQLVNNVQTTVSPTISPVMNMQPVFNMGAGNASAHFSQPGPVANAPPQQAPPPMYNPAAESETASKV
jgi:hypothetical protein